EIALSGSGSVDGSGDPLAFNWSVVATPGRSDVTDDDMDGADAEEMRFTPDASGEYLLELVAEGGGAFSAPDRVSVRVEGDVLVPEDYRSVGAAVHAAVSGATVRIAEGVWPTQLVLAAKDISLAGAGADLTVLDGEGTGQVIRAIANEDVVLTDLTITGGFGANAGGIEKVGGSLVLEDVTLSFNDGVLGGAVYASGVLLTATDIRVHDNLATRLAGGLYLLNQSSADIARALFANNACYGQFGGAMQVWQSDLTLSNAVLSGNYADMGGALFFTGTEDSKSTGVFDHVTATLNQADRNGAIMRVVWSDVEVTNSIFAYQYDGTAVSIDTAFSDATYFQDEYTVMFNNVEGDWFGFDDPPVPVVVNPELTSISDDDDWTNDDWSLVSPTSPAIDAADPSAPADVDGSPADLGAFGGPLGDWMP
ncbi:MAG: hypothetical protein ACI9K2_005778, partial [Myxococcota bacterium]